jgi:hypothetical protein
MVVADRVDDPLSTIGEGPDDGQIQQAGPAPERAG